MTNKQNTPQQLFTVGYGGRKPSDFVSLIQTTSVKTVVDVRLRPDRASMGAYVRAKSNDKGIVKLLATAGIGYASLVELGNVFGELTEWREPYRKLLNLAGPLLVDRLSNIEGPFALMCAEKDVGKCHRKLIADYLVGQGFQLTVHLL